MMFRQLEYFVAVAREEHFAGAAEACFVSQPALSEALRKLERELGVALVRRGNSFNGLTPGGSAVGRLGAAHSRRPRRTESRSGGPALRADR
jgi:DNA-binding transcriptional LysR family regulator